MPKDFPQDIIQENAQQQGMSFTKSLDYLKSQTDHQEAEAEDFIITAFFEAADGLYQVQPQGDTQWELPLPSQNQYVGIVVRDKKDLRFIPNLLVYTHLYDNSGKLIADQRQSFTWDPFIYHYGSNFLIPKQGDYILEIDIEKPKFQRRNHDMGNRYKSRTTVKLGPIHLSPARKEYASEGE